MNFKVIANYLDYDQRVRDRFFIHQIASLPPGKLLDLGAGGGPYRATCLDQGYSYYSQDYCQLPEALLKQGSYAPIDLVCDAASLPLEDHFFDYVLCSEVLEHVTNPQQVISEISRVLKPGGKLLFSVPYLTPAHQLPFCYVSGFTAQWIFKVFNDNNLSPSFYRYPLSGLDNLCKLLTMYAFNILASASALNPFKYILALMILPCILFLSLAKIIANSVESSVKNRLFVYGHLVIASKSYNQ